MDYLKKKIGLKDDCKGLGLSKWKNGVAILQTGSTLGETNLG